MHTPEPADSPIATRLQQFLIPSSPAHIQGIFDSFWMDISGGFMRRIVMLPEEIEDGVDEEVQVDVEAGLEAYFDMMETDWEEEEELEVAVQYGD